MAQVTPTTTTTTHPKHNIHKFRDIKPRLGRENWVSWKCELLATARDRGLYATVLRTDLIPVTTNPSVIMSAGIAYMGAIRLAQLIDEWNDRNNTAYNQIMLCISPELQTAIDNTDQAKDAWKIIIGKFESIDPSKISIIRTKYKKYHMIEGQSVVTYITTMKEFKNQLTKMGETIANSTHLATLLRNVPESWRPIAQTIRMITRVPEEIEERLEAHEADLNALEVLDQAATAFAARAKPNRL
jgi:gag-polypeptide of LTR copia-type